tara:strand:+ start:3725 stop:4189 length:465 start_codon:yes stop_codon:yes gene_type:complete
MSEETPVPSEVPQTAVAEDSIPSELQADLDLLGEGAEGDQGQELQQKRDEQRQAEIQSQHEKTKEEFCGLFKGILKPTFDVVAPNWQVSDGEAGALAEAYSEVCAHYFPDGAGELGPWPAALLCTALVVGPKIKTPMRAIPESEAEGQTVEQRD